VGKSGPTGSVSATRVELRLAGTFRVVRDGTELTDGEIGSRKSRTLLKLLAVERPGLVPVDRIVEVLWPNERPAAPGQNVATLVSRLRAVLGADVIPSAGRTTTFSTLLCVPNALSQSGGFALGAQAGEAAIRQVITDAGFTRFRRAAETPFNLVYEVRP